MSNLTLLRRTFGGIVLGICFLSFPAAAGTFPDGQNIDKMDVPACDSARCDICTVKTTKLALKTNLFFDAVGAPNLGVEVPFGRNRNFSAALDLAYACWSFDNLYALQTMQGGVGVKYWFNPRGRALTGWNAGVYGVYGGRYDVQWLDGYQGDRFWSAGISGGYSARIAKKLNLEFALAAGYFRTPQVRHYHEPEKGHLLWQETRYNTGRFSLTKVQINLVWLIGGKKR
jgi:hypothetical protein